MLIPLYPQIVITCIRRNTKNTLHPTTIRSRRTVRGRIYPSRNQIKTKNSQRKALSTPKDPKLGHSQVKLCRRTTHSLSHGRCCSCFQRQSRRRSNSVHRPLRRWLQRSTEQPPRSLPPPAFRSQKLLESRRRSS